MSIALRMSGLMATSISEVVIKDIERLMTFETNQNDQNNGQ